MLLVDHVTTVSALLLSPPVCQVHVRPRRRHRAITHDLAACLRKKEQERDGERARKDKEKPGQFVSECWFGPDVAMSWCPSEYHRKFRNPLTFNRMSDLPKNPMPVQVLRDQPTYHWTQTGTQHTSQRSKSDVLPSLCRRDNVRDHAIGERHCTR